MFTKNTEVLLKSGIGNPGTDNQISEESYDWFIGTLSKSINAHQTEWFEFFRKYKLMILSYKYFSGRKLVNTEELKSNLKFELKRFYTPLQMAIDELDFFKKVCALPSRIIFIIVRLCFEISKELDNIVVVTKKEIRAEIKRLRELRFKVAKNISNVSSYYQDVFNITDFVEIYNNGLLVENNFINQGICDFFLKLVKDEDARKKLSDYKLNSFTIKVIEEELSSYPSYIYYRKQILDGRDIEFFDYKGQQIGRRFENVFELVQGDSDLGGFVIDFNSRFKEPNDRVEYEVSNEPEFDEVSNEEEEGGVGPVSNSGGMGRSFSNDADISVPDFGSPEGGIETGAPEGPSSNEDETNELPDDFGPN